MWSLFVTLTLIASEAVYLRGWYRLRKAIPDLVSVWRSAGFACGLLALWAVVASPLAAMDHHLLTAHMTQHLILMTVSAPLILLGAPVIVLLNGLPKPLGRFFSGPSAQTLGGMVTRPLLCWFVNAATVIAWHMPALFELGMSARWHEVEYGCFFTAGILFWLPVIQPWPSLTAWSTWGVPLYLFLATLPCDALSAFLTFCDRVVYPHYQSMDRFFDIPALADQQFAGALMWVWVTFAYLAPAVVVTIRALSPQRHTLNAKVA